MHTASSPHPRRAYWLKTLYEWHWVSSALCLVGMLVFAFTGFTLNHAGQIEAKSQTHTAQAQLPAVVLEPLQAAAQATAAQQLNAPIPEALQQLSQRTLGANLAHRTPEWSADELYIPLPRPGGDAWLRIDLESGGPSTKARTGAGFRISTICTKGATRAWLGAGSWIFLRPPAWCSV